ncbi:MAG: SDR family oxidoreductase [Chitinophagaceae bacterium]|nr:MAG: SDR family oxidoreductase [Chitinophagaceae bacterium]
MNIVIFGASGATGQQLVKQAISKGYHVTAFLRQTSKFSLVHDRLNIIRGDINNLEQVLEVLDEKDAVLSALGASSPFSYDQSLVDGFKVIIKGMEICEINRFVYMSFMGVKDSRKQAGVIVKYLAPVLLGTEIKGHENREKMIMESDLGWTIVRPPTLTNGKQLGKYRSGEDIHSTRFADTISRADVAEFMLSQLTNDQYLFSKPALMY